MRARAGACARLVAISGDRAAAFGTEAGVGGIRTVRAPEYRVDEVVVSIGPVAGVVGVRPESVFEYVGIGVGPEHRAQPRHKSRTMAAPPGMPGSPAVFPRRQRQAGLRLVIAAEACGKPPAFGGLRGGGCSGRSRSRR